jgi:hypothetical protein
MGNMRGCHNDVVYCHLFHGKAGGEKNPGDGESGEILKQELKCDE